MAAAAVATARHATRLQLSSTIATAPALVRAIAVGLKQGVFLRLVVVCLGEVRGTKSKLWGCRRRGGAWWDSGGYDSADVRWLWMVY
jgi:hypothetical protein